MKTTDVILLVAVLAAGGVAVFAIAKASSKPAIPAAPQQQPGNQLGQGIGQVVGGLIGLL